MISGLLVLGAIAFGLTFVIEMVQNKWAVEDHDLIEKINSTLPQTQCAQCGYPGCKPYAQAIARDQAPIDLCPPGGEVTVTALAKLLDRNPYGVSMQKLAPALAIIREDQCIGCTLCIQACPVDAIVGASQWMHTVISERCTGCELCIDPCPVDCIDMQVQPTTSSQAPAPHPIPCVHCGACTAACPVSLDAEHLYQLTAQDHIASAVADGALQCIRCGQCDTVCPSHIPLVTFFRYAQQRNNELQLIQQRSVAAQQLYQEQQQRIHNTQAQQQLTMQQKREQLKTQLQDKKTPSH